MLIILNTLYRFTDILYMISGTSNRC